MNTNKKIVFVVVGIIILAGTFYGGMSYSKSQTTSGLAGAGANRIGQFSMNGKGNTRTNTGGFTSGEIISKDDKSITIKLTNGDVAGATNPGGSKIVFIDTSTTVAKMATGSLSDLTNGTQVSITGTTNPDGSVIAKSIQIRPQVKPNTQVQ